MEKTYNIFDIKEINEEKSLIEKIQTALKDVENERVYTSIEVKKELREKYNI